MAACEVPFQKEVALFLTAAVSRPKKRPSWTPERSGFLTLPAAAQGFAGAGEGSRVWASLPSATVQIRSLPSWQPAASHVGPAATA